jgi:hypothetical protein
MSNELWWMVILLKQFILDVYHVLVGCLKYTYIIHIMYALTLKK